MKISKFISAVFSLLGLLLLTGTVALSVLSLNAPAKLLGSVPEAEARAEEWAAAVCRGDYAAAGALMYGQPELAPDRTPAYAVGGVLWDAFQERLSCSFSSDCYATDSGVARDMTITALDVSRVMKPLKEHLEPLLVQRAEETDDDIVLDDDGGYREEFVMDVLCEAAEDVLMQQDFTVQRTVTLKLVCEDGQWWILPEQELIRILSGSLGKGD